MIEALAKKIAVVTGAESGIGQAIAAEFARAGADIVIIWFADEAAATRTSAEVEGAGRRALLRQCDVRDQRAVAGLFDALVPQFGTPDILVNCAGIGASGSRVPETTGEAWDAVIRTDLYGPFFCCRHFLEARGAAQGGRIINITSVHEAIPSPGNAAYGAAKGGLLTFTRSLALEVAASGMTVNAIAPGLIRTPMTEGVVADPEKLRAAVQNIPLRRPGEPREVARLALYLASEDAAYVTGQSFTIDGGLEMNWGQGA